jgi:hypothetical protein
MGKDPFRDRRQQDQVTETMRSLEKKGMLMTESPNVQGTARSVRVIDNFL